MKIKTTRKATGDSWYANEATTASHKRRTKTHKEPNESLSDASAGQKGSDLDSDLDTAFASGQNTVVAENLLGDCCNTSLANGGLTPNPIKQDAAGECVAVTDTTSACRQLQQLQRRRIEVLKMRIALENQLVGIIKCRLGYFPAMGEEERAVKHKEALSLIKAIKAGDLQDMNGHTAIAIESTPLVQCAVLAIGDFQGQINEYEKSMAKLAKSLPVHSWVKSVRGFGTINLAIIVGECGDLSQYAGPAKLWKRFGLAPVRGRMPSWWRWKGGLSAEEWTDAGYSPRRRSSLHMLSQNMVMNNDGAYRKRYEESKAAKLALESDEWPKIRCHRHGILLALKRLIRDLWRKWRDLDTCGEAISSQGPIINLPPHQPNGRPSA
jgi:hypothetical protein